MGVVFFLSIDRLADDDSGQEESHSFSENHIRIIWIRMPKSILIFIGPIIAVGPINIGMRSITK